MDERERTKLIRFISNVVLVCIPSFGTIQLKPSAAEGPGITLFQRNLLLAYNEIDSQLAEVALKYFYDHAQQWVTPIHAALSVYVKVPPHCVQAVLTGHFPDYVDARKVLQERRASLKDIFTLGSKAAACILCSEVLKAHWRISTTTIELRKVISQN